MGSFAFHCSKLPPDIFDFISFSVPDEVHLGDDESTLPSIQTETSSRYLGEDLPQINGFSGSRLYTQMAKKDWESALATIEEHPEEGREWQYGIELDRIESMDSAIMWKRLPIHSACVLHAPIGVIEALLWAHPKGIRVKDPFTGALPLHLACRHSAPPDLVKTIIMAYPEASCITDVVGRLPLHTVCLSGASRLTFIYLLKAYPHAILMKDGRRRTPLQYAKKNPTLKPETIELLELVHQFLKEQPAADDGYTFDGFSSPRSVGQSSDDGSTLSGFYEDNYSIGQYVYADEDYNLSPCSVSQPLEKDEDDEMLANQFSQILDPSDGDDTPLLSSAEEDIAGRVTPKFSVSKARREKEQALKKKAAKPGMLVKELSQIVEEESDADEVDTAAEEDSTLEELPNFSVPIVTEAVAHPAASNVVVAKKASENVLQIQEEVVDAKQVQSSAEELIVVKITKLGTLMTRHSEEQASTSSVVCVNGVDQPTRSVNDQPCSADAVDSIQVENVDDEAAQKDIFEAEDKSTSDDLQGEPEKSSSSESHGEQLPEGVDSEFIDKDVSKKPSIVNDVDEDKKQDEVSFATELSIEAHEDAVKAEITEASDGSVVAGEVDVEIHGQEESSSALNDESVESVPLEDVLESNGEKSTEKVETEIRNRDDSVSVGQVRDTPAMIFVPADVAAGCSPLTVPVVEALNRVSVANNSFTTKMGKADDRSSEPVIKVSEDEKAFIDDEGSVPYELLVDDHSIETMKAANIKDSSKEECDKSVASIASNHLASGQLAGEVGSKTNNMSLRTHVKAKNQMEKKSSTDGETPKTVFTASPSYNDEGITSLVIHPLSTLPPICSLTPRVTFLNSKNLLLKLIPILVFIQRRRCPLLFKSATNKTR